MKIKFIKDPGKNSEYKNGDVVECSFKDAKELVEGGFAKYVKKKPNAASDEDETPKIKTSSYYKNDDVIIEQVYDADKKLSEFLVFTPRDKKIMRVPWYKYNGYRYEPINDEELHLGIISLPSGVGYYNEVTDLIQQIKGFIHKYLDIDKNYLQFAAWYVLLTWVYDRFNTLNYLRALGDTGVGKSRFLDVIGGLCYKNLRGSGATTVAALKRITKKWGGTIVIDEGDFRESDEKAELIKYFNLGFEKNRPLINCDKNDPNKLEFFLPYCPKILATRQTFKDKALEARCLTNVLQQTRREDIPVVLFDNFYAEQKKLMNKLLKFRFDTLFTIDSSKEVKLETSIKIEPRLKQATYSFVNIFSENEEAMKQFIEFIEKAQTDLVDERANSFEGMIINAIHDLMMNHLDFNEDLSNFVITSQNIVEKIQSLYSFESKTNVIGRRLKSLGIETSVRKIDGKSKKPLTITPQFLQHFERYIPTKLDEKLVTVVTAVTAYTAQHQNLIKQSNRQNSEILSKKGKEDVTAVTAVTAVTQKTQKNDENLANYTEEFVEDEEEEKEPKV